LRVLEEIVIDSGPTYYLDGQYCFRQLDELALNVSAATEITDAGWLEFLTGSFATARTLGLHPKATIAYFSRAFPNATQRQLAKKFIEQNRVRKLERLAALTDSAMLRGALTALNWIMPDSQMQAYTPREYAQALSWVHEVANFDVASAHRAWREACHELKL
jgi:hypothetical protein